MANIVVLPEVTKLDTIKDSANILVEQDGSINRFAVTDLDIGGGDITVDMNATGGSLGPISNINAQTLDGYKAEDFVKNNEGFLSINLDNYVNGEHVLTNADRFGGQLPEYYAIKSDLEQKLSMELLWENSSPTSGFAGGREITYASGYEKYRLELNAHYGRTGASIDFKPGEGLIASLMWGDDGIYVSRSFDTTANSLKANDGYQSKAVNNSVMVPVRIYGIKGVL